VRRSTASLWRLSLYNRNWKEVAAVVRTKTVVQVRSALLCIAACCSCVTRDNSRLKHGTDTGKHSPTLQAKL
jgi:hypothetical protein